MKEETLVDPHNANENIFFYWVASGGLLLADAKSTPFIHML